MPSPFPKLTLSALGLAAAAAVGSAGTVQDGVTLRPVVGIYSAPLDYSTTGCENKGDCDYVAASYVKWLEHAGAESFPIPYDVTEDEADALFPQLNGVLFPGGGSSLPDGARHIFDLALKANDNGTHFPVWGTCLGFEWLMELVGGSDVLVGGFDSENITMALNLTDAAATSRLLGPVTLVPGHRDRSDAAAASFRADLSNKDNPPAMNNHQAGVSPKTFASNKDLPTFFNVLSTNLDRKGLEFVSTVEGSKYPVYGAQWHPEKNNFEWGLRDDGEPYEVINHSPEAVFVSQSLANFFVGETRRNVHTRDRADDSTKLFWDYAVSQVRAPEFEQVYLIPISKKKN